MTEGPLSSHKPTRLTAGMLTRARSLSCFSQTRYPTVVLKTTRFAEVRHLVLLIRAPEHTEERNLTPTARASTPLHVPPPLLVAKMFNDRTFRIEAATL